MGEKWLKFGDANFGGSERKTKIGLREGRDGTAKDRSHLKGRGSGDVHRNEGTFIKVYVQTSEGGKGVQNVL